MRAAMIIALAVLALTGCAERRDMTDKEASAIVQALKRSP